MYDIHTLNAELKAQLSFQTAKPTIILIMYRIKVHLFKNRIDIILANYKIVAKVKKRIPNV